MKISRTGKDLFKMVNYAIRPSRIREEYKGYAPSLQAMSSLIGFLEKKIRKYLSDCTSINAVSIVSGMECEMYSIYQTPTIKIRSGISFYISLYLLWTIQNTM